MVYGVGGGAEERAEGQGQIRKARNDFGLSAEAGEKLSEGSVQRHSSV